LIVEDGGKELPLVASKTEFIIGRSDPISGIYPEVDLTSYGGETSGVSRQHARLVLSAGQWFLTDLNSTNHTKIDGVRIDPNVPAPVQNGARLQFGRLTLLFRA
jgi:pSer/pThr/pTyr-binding forkhead associated (FHA) protein